MLHSNKSFPIHTLVFFENVGVCMLFAWLVVLLLPVSTSLKKIKNKNTKQVHHQWAHLTSTMQMLSSWGKLAKPLIQRSMEHQTKPLIPKFCILWCRKIFICIYFYLMLLFDFCFYVYLVVSPIYCGQQFRIFLVYMYNLSYQNYLAKSWDPKATFHGPLVIYFKVQIPKDWLIK